MTENPGSNLLPWIDRSSIAWRADEGFKSRRAIIGKTGAGFGREFDSPMEKIR